eukprot:2825960-Amphidinium_carterae.2
MLDVALPCGASPMLGVLRQALILRGRKVAQRRQENNDDENDVWMECKFQFSCFWQRRLKNSASDLKLQNNAKAAV